MRRLRVLLLFGGESPEHEVSVASARNVYAALDDQKYEIYLCYISKDGYWRLVDDIETLDVTHRSLLPVLGGKHFLIEPDGASIVPDVLLPILHGANGEDGAVQALARLLHIPIVGCDILGSAICMDKDVTKRLLKNAGVETSDYVLHVAGQPEPDFSRLTLRLGNPLFVKPASQGSSVGASKVYNEQQFAKAMSAAHKHDRKVLIEQYISGNELECAVLGNDKPEASGVGQIKPGEDFYSYEDKYSPASQAKIIIPAEINEKMAEEVRHMAVKAYQTLECRGLARVDFFATDAGQIYVNELNTLPGFTNISMYPKLWRAAGFSYSQLVDKLINLALEG